MKRALVLSSACLFLVSLAGCSRDPRDEEIKKIIAHLEQASSEINTVTSKIKATVKEADKGAEKKEITEADLKPALEAIDSLDKLGRQFQFVKARIDALPDVPTDDQKAKLVADNKADLESKIDRLNTAQRELEAELKAAAPYINRDALAVLRTKLKEAQEKYLTLGQRQ